MLLHFSTIGVSVHTEQPSVSIEGMRMNVELCHDVLVAQASACVSAHTRTCGGAGFILQPDGRLKPNAVQLTNPGTVWSSRVTILSVVVAGFPACLSRQEGRLESLLPPENCP